MLKIKFGCVTVVGRDLLHFCHVLLLMARFISDATLTTKEDVKYACLSNGCVISLFDQVLHNDSKVRSISSKHIPGVVEGTIVGVVFIRELKWT